MTGPAPDPLDNADFRAIALRLLKPEKTMPGYDEGWNDALYSLLDILDATHSATGPEMSDDWTAEGGRSNSSVLFLSLVDEIEVLIRSDAHMLLAGQAGKTAQLILANLAHVHGLGPVQLSDREAT